MPMKAVSALQKKAAHPIQRKNSIANRLLIFTSYQIKYVTRFLRALSKENKNLLSVEGSPALPIPYHPQKFHSNQISHAIIMIFG